MAGTASAALLGRIFPAERIKTDAGDLAFWGRDWARRFTARPAAIVFPERIDEVAALVRLAGAEGFALVPSGGRTGLSGGAAAENGEVVVSFDRMRRILDFDAADRIARCQAGVTTAALQAFAAQRGLRYPVDFASAGTSQIGGNVATNAGGIQVIRYGTTRNWVAGLTVVTGAGDVLELNRGLAKNATGYDLRHLFIGSEGTLGCIVEVLARLAPAPAPSRVMLIGVARFADLPQVLPRFAARLPLTAFEFFCNRALGKVLAHAPDARRPLAAPSPFYALLEFDAADEQTAQQAFAECAAEGLADDGVVSRSDAQARSLWVLREGIAESLAPHSPCKHDIAVRSSAMPDFLAAAQRLVAEVCPEFEACWFGHIGDGNLHLNVLKPAALDAEAFHARCDALAPRLFALVGAHGGSISAEHGVGLAKRDFLGYSRSDREIDIMRAIKGVLDPRGVMNPGKLLA